MGVGQTCAKQKQAVDQHKITVIFAVLGFFEAFFNRICSEIVLEYVDAVTIHLKTALSDARSDGGVNLRIATPFAQSLDCMRDNATRRASPARVHRRYGQHPSVGISCLQQNGHAIRTLDAKWQTCRLGDVAVTRSVGKRCISPARIGLCHGHHVRTVHLRQGDHALCIHTDSVCENPQIFKHGGVVIPSAKGQIKPRQRGIRAFSADSR